MKLLLRWAASAIALLLVAHLVPGISIESWGVAFVAALVLGLINAVIRPAVKLLTTPIRWLTLGLFTLVINAVLFYFAATLVDGFDASGAGDVFIGALLYGIAASVLQSLFGAKKK
ncbi:MAG: phage holin family protein [Bacteroidota bacterium]